MAVSYLDYHPEELRARSGFIRILDRIDPDEVISFGADMFPSLPQTAVYDPSDHSYTPVEIPGAHFYRLSMTAADGRRWIIFHENSDAFSFPNPGDYGFDSLQAVKVEAQALMTVGGIGLNQFLGFSSINMDDTIKLIEGFSSIAVYRQ